MRYILSKHIKKDGLKSKFEILCQSPDLDYITTQLLEFKDIKLDRDSILITDTNGEYSYILLDSKFEGDLPDSIQSTTKSIRRDIMVELRDEKLKKLNL